MDYHTIFTLYWYGIISRPIFFQWIDRYGEQQEEDRLDCYYRSYYGQLVLKDLNKNYI